MAFYLDGIKTEGDSIVEKSIALVSSARLV